MGAQSMAYKVVTMYSTADPCQSMRRNVVLPSREPMALERKTDNLVCEE